VTDLLSLTPDAARAALAGSAIALSAVVTAAGGPGFGGAVAAAASSTVYAQ